MIDALALERSPASPPTGAAVAEAHVRMDVPGDGWTLEELYDRAAWGVAQIGKSRRCAPRYWYFGKAMLLVQEQVADGGWKAWCAAQHIPADRWKRGRLLALASESPEPLAELTIEAATHLARERLGLPRRLSTADAKLRRSLTAVKKTLQSRLDEFDRVTRPDGLRTLIADLIRQLTALDHACVVLERCRRSAVSKRRREKHPK